jgi:hypothetical protein
VLTIYGSGLPRDGGHGASAPLPTYEVEPHASSSRLLSWLTNHLKPPPFFAAKAPQLLVALTPEEQRQ